jgi:hypothetical protein
LAATTATAPGLDLSWLDLYDEPTSATPGKKGLTLRDINLGRFGDPARGGGDMTFRLRGATPRPGAQRFGTNYQSKADVWSENCLMLYEEAVQRQWASARDIPWDTLEQLPEPDDIERAMCQLCTMLTEVEFIAGDVPGQWLPYVSAQDFEAGLFLMTQIMDEARHTDVFRKRALVNGGGLLAQGQSGLRTLLEARDFTEMSVLMHVQAEGFVQSMFRMGELIGQTDADKRIFRMSAQDESRHLAFGVMHLKYVLDTEPERREEIHHYLDKSEVDGGGASGDIQLQEVFESLAILLGGGKEKFDEGVQKFLLLRKRQVNEYVHRLEVCGLGDRRNRLGPLLAQFVDPA